MITELSQMQLISLGLTSVVAGMLSSISGSGGLLILPGLLMTGLPPQMALGTYKMFSTASLFTSSICFIKQRLFDPKLWVAAMAATLFGSLVGTTFAIVLSDAALAIVIPAFLFMLCIYFLLPSSWAEPDKHANTKPHCKIRDGIVSVLLGIYNGFVGAGAASIWTAVAMRLFQLNLLEASALSRVMTFVANVSALVIFMSINRVDYTIGALLVVTSVVGALIGAKLCLRYGKSIIRPTTVIITTVMTTKLILNAL